MNSRFVFIHGMDSCAGTWKVVLDELAGHGHVSCVAINVPGHGGVPGPGLGGKIDLEQTFSVIDQAFQGGGDARLVLVGHSAGARLAVLYVSSRPALSLHTLVLEDMGVEDRDPPKRLTQEQEASLLACPTRAASLEEAKALLAGFGYSPGPHMDRYARPGDGRLVVQDDGSVQINVRPHSRYLVARDIMAADLSDPVKRIRASAVKVLCLVADKESAVGKNAMTSLVQGFGPEATIKVVPRSKHSIHSTNTEAFTKELLALTLT
jgi:pimeloyl-ACP methyl ester carboxylesterase